MPLPYGGDARFATLNNNLPYSMALYAKRKGTEVSFLLYGVDNGIRLHFRRRRKYRCGRGPTRPSTCPRQVEFHGSNPIWQKTRKDTEVSFLLYGVDNGIRTHDLQSHNLTR